MPNSARSPSSEPSDSSAPSISAASTPPTSATGSGQERERRQAPAAEGRLQQQEDGDRAAMPNAIIRSRRSPRRRLLQHLRVVLEREADVREAVLDVVRDVAEAAPADVGLDVDAARDRVALDDGRRRTTRTSATSPRRTWPPPGRSISRLRTLATLRRVPRACPGRSRRTPSGPRRRCRPGCPAAASPPRGARRPA